MNTVDELWTEYEKAIKAENWFKFKTRRGMIGYLKRYVKSGKAGKSIKFRFLDFESGNYIFKELELLSKDIMEA